LVEPKGKVLVRVDTTGYQSGDLLLVGRAEQVFASPAVLNMEQLARHYQSKVLR
jgi:hypothetical protein